MSYRSEFPDFDPATMPELPQGWADRSWRNEPMPCFIHEDSGLVLWIDYTNAEQREHEGGQRFALERLGTYHPEAGWQFDGEQMLLVETDEWDVVLQALGMPPFDAAKVRRDVLEQEVKAAGAALGGVSGISTGRMGLTPDSVKATPEYRAAKLRYDRAHRALAGFNGRFCKAFAADLRAERRERGR